MFTNLANELGHHPVCILPHQQSYTFPGAEAPAQSVKSFFGGTGEGRR